VTADHHDAIRVINEGLGNHRGVNPAGTHDSDDANIRRILNPGNSSEISRCVSSPSAAEHQDPGSEIGQESHLLQKDQIRNPKHEILNNAQMLKIQITQTWDLNLCKVELETLEHLNFEFVSCFVLRISDLCDQAGSS
jgi:hypothetical protein